MEARLSTVESGLVELQAEVNSLVGLRLQLQQTLETRRGQRPGSVPSPSRPNGRPATPEADSPGPSVAPAAPADEPDTAAKRGGVEPVAVHHFDDVAAISEAVRSAVERLGYAMYNPRPPLPATLRRELLAVNLLLGSTDPVARVLEASRNLTEGPTAFTYCADADHSLILGMVSYLPPPFDADACITRLLQRQENLQKVLIVCETVDVSTALRGVLRGFGGTVSMAFSARQAVELVPLVQPDVVLLDLDLPRGEAWRTIASLRAKPLCRRVPLALMWQRPVNVDELRLHGGRAARDFPLSVDELCQGLRRELSPPIGAR